MDSKASKWHNNKPHAEMKKLCVEITDKAPIPVMGKRLRVPPYPEHRYIQTHFNNKIMTITITIRRFQTKPVELCLVSETQPCDCDRAVTETWPCLNIRKCSQISQ